MQTKRLVKFLLPALAISCLMSAPALAQSQADFPAGWQQMRQDYADQALVNRFYDAFAAHDGATMAASYHPEAEFVDPAFGQLKGKEIGAMWQMLLAAAAGGLKVSHRDVHVSQGKGRAHWDASYVFSATGNRVDNSIDAEFEFKDGLIWRHRDHFDMHRWSSQALGLPGMLLGHTPLVPGLIQAQARRNLKAWMDAHPN